LRSNTSFAIFETDLYRNDRCGTFLETKSLTGQTAFKLVDYTNKILIRLDVALG